jgi:hypothetical protein
LPAMNTTSMDVLLIQRVRGISRGTGRKPTAGTEISRSAAPKAGRVTTTRALGFGCHSVSERSLLARATQGSDYIRRWGQPEYWNT